MGEYGLEVVQFGDAMCSRGRTGQHVARRIEQAQRRQRRQIARR